MGEGFDLVRCIKLPKQRDTIDRDRLHHLALQVLAHEMLKRGEVQVEVFGRESEQRGVDADDDHMCSAQRVALFERRLSKKVGGA